LLINDLKIIEFKKEYKEQIIKLFFEFGGYLKKLDENHLNLITVPDNYGEYYYKNLIDETVKKDGKILLLMDGEKVAGFIAGILKKIGETDKELDCKPHLMGRVIELYISKNSRHKGFGSKLMAEMVKYFKSKNCYKVNIEAFGPNTRAIEFYQKQGFEVRNVDLTKVI
jgi:ribosomal protein S18 acetylase RimI-like enzyme